MDVQSRADRFTEARVQAGQALRASAWTSVTVAGWTLLATVAALGAVLQGVGSIGQIHSVNGWYFVSLSIPVALLVYAVLEFKRIRDRAVALKVLFDAQREYEALLLDARQERDAQHQRAEALLIQNEHIRQTAHLVGLFRTAVMEKKDE